MAIEIRVPTLGESISEATVGKWFKKAGEPVRADEPLVELETDKVTLEVNAPGAGVLSEITAETGQTVAIGALLGQLSGGATAPPRRRLRPRRLKPPPLRAHNGDAAGPVRRQDRRRGQDRSRLRRRQRKAGPGAQGRRARGRRRSERFRRRSSRRRLRLRQFRLRLSRHSQWRAQRRPTTAPAKSGCG